MVLVAAFGMAVTFLLTRHFIRGISATTLQKRAMDATVFASFSGSF